jgi:hypothetical protein
MSETNVGTIPAYLPTMFTDKRFRQIRERIYYAEIDGRKTGVVLATMYPNRDSYALNCAEHEHVRGAKLAGKIDEALVVAVKINSFGTLPEYQCGNFIEAMSTIGLRKIAGRHGDFWLLHLGNVDPNSPL